MAPEDDVIRIRRQLDIVREELQRIVEKVSKMDYRISELENRGYVAPTRYKGGSND